MIIQPEEDLNDVHDVCLVYDLGGRITLLARSSDLLICLETSRFLSCYKNYF